MSTTSKGDLYTNLVVVDRDPSKADLDDLKDILDGGAAEGGEDPAAREDEGPRKRGLLVKYLFLIPGLEDKWFNKTGILVEQSPSTFL